MGESKQYILLRRILKALGLSDDRVEEIVALIQSWLDGEKGEKELRLPYKLRDDFLSPAELNFYRLDDRSHQREDRKERDTFVEGVFKAAGLPLARIPVRQSYQVEELKNFLRQKSAQEPVLIPKENEPKRSGNESISSVVTCPNCGSEMVLRTARSGPNKGNQFWGCSSYPKCKTIIAYEG